MTRNRFSQAKHQWRSMTGGLSGNPLLGSTSTISSADRWHNLTLSKARGLFLEDNDNIYMKDTYKITNVHSPIDEKDVVNKEYCDNNFHSSYNKIDSLSKNITELRKVDFDKVTTKTLQLIITHVNDELTIEFIESANEVKKTVNFCNKVAADTISKYNQLKQELDNNKFNQNITNIHLDDMLTNGLRGFKEVNEKTNSFIDEAPLMNKKTIVQYIVAKLLESKLFNNKEQAGLDMHYDFNHEDVMRVLLYSYKYKELLQR